MSIISMIHAPYRHLAKCIKRRIHNPVAHISYIGISHFRNVESERKLDVTTKCSRVVDYSSVVMSNSVTPHRSYLSRTDILLVRKIFC